MKFDSCAEIWRTIDVKSDLYTYKVSTYGRVMKTSKKQWKESMVSLYMKRGKLAAKIAQQEFYVKHLVAAAFIYGYKKSDSVTHKDGNPQNCSVENLLVFSKQQLGKLTGGDSRRKPIVANGIEYGSVRECAKSLHCSYQTVLDYIGGKVKNSVLGNIEIKEINEYV